MIVKCAGYLQLVLNAVFIKQAVISFVCCS